jgi:hypothetical protein
LLYQPWQNKDEKRARLPRQLLASSLANSSLSRVQILIGAGSGSLFRKRYFKPLKKKIEVPCTSESILYLAHFPTKEVESRARQCKTNVKIGENVNCGADTPEMKYSGHTWFKKYHLYIYF